MTQFATAEGAATAPSPAELFARLIDDKFVGADSESDFLTPYKETVRLAVGTLSLAHGVEYADAVRPVRGREAEAAEHWPYGGPHVSIPLDGIQLDLSTYNTELRARYLDHDNLFASPPRHAPLDEQKTAEVLAWLEAAQPFDAA